MIQFGADLSGLGNYIGVVGGFIEAIEHPGFEGDFTQHLSDTIKAHFMTESIAANVEGTANIAHVFEWGEVEDTGSSVPLFRLINATNGTGVRLGYEFLPSTELVPLPDPSKYGFEPSKIANMRRHTFQLKAVVMETMNKVTVSPVGAKRLFIPDKTKKRGYYMSSTPVHPNPGGPQSTGGFASWWKFWFDSRAEKIVKEESQRTEDFLVLTGRKYVRYAAGTKMGGTSVGGRFASGKGISLSYINAESRRVKSAVLRDAEKHFDSQSWESTWDGD